MSERKVGLTALGLLGIIIGSGWVAVAGNTSAQVMLLGIGTIVGLDVWHSTIKI